MFPTLTRTWQFNVNQLIPSSASGAAGELEFSRKVLFALKESLIGFTHSPWTVVASSDTSSAALSDLWLDYLDITWNTTSRSWTLLRQTGIAPNFEVLIDCHAGTTGHHVIDLRTCPDGFNTTTISPTVIPTPNTSRYTEQLDTYYAQPVDNTYTGRLHVMQDTDGANTRWFWCEYGSAYRIGGFSKVADATTWTPGWNDPYVVIGPAAPTYASFSDSASNLRAYYEGSYNAQFNMYLSCEFFGSAAMGQQFTQSDDLGRWEIYPANLASMSNVGVRGPRRGSIDDLWWGATGQANGATYPVAPNPTNEFAQIGNLVIPWNGTKVRVT